MYVMVNDMGSEFLVKPDKFLEQNCKNGAHSPWVQPKFSSFGSLQKISSFLAFNSNKHHMHI